MSGFTQSCESESWVMSDVTEKFEQRLKALRKELGRRDLDGFVVPLADEHMSEYVGAYARRLEWLTGFSGSAGIAVVLSAKAAIVVDARYSLQVREEVDERNWSYQTIANANALPWLAEHAPEHARIGYDPWLHTKSWVKPLRAVLAEKNTELVAVESNAVDAVWHDRPPPPDAKLVIHHDRVAGRTSADKRCSIADWLTARNVDAVVVSALDSIAWIFNVRGRDVEHTPVALAFALVCADGTADLFIAPEKLTDVVISHLGTGVRLHSDDTFVRHLRTLANKRIALDPEVTVTAIVEAIDAAGAVVIEARDPAALPKAIKNAVEITGHKAAQARDGAALSRFLHWLSTEAPKGALTEISAAAQLREFREATGYLCDLSFKTISAFGPSGGLIHYHATKETDRLIVPDGIYLVDSGGQYVDGTTDVTRTIAIGLPVVDVCECFTLVLKGHIALARAIFPIGTRGIQLDVLARQHLWTVGRDYGHGTGHGVGSYLGVHEGPQKISRIGGNEPLLPGMIVSNEPGYYKTGEYGIRIENLMLIVERQIPRAEHPMLGFELLTFAPIDRTLIKLSMLTSEERAWLDSYHADVARIVGPQLDGQAKAWVMESTRPLT
jgi:Xaa-Pro aminopeptidase